MRIPILNVLCRGTRLPLIWQCCTTFKISEQSSLHSDCYLSFLSETCRFFIKMGADFFGFAYAATVAAGGILGFVKAQSVPSLAAGVVFGGLLGYGAYQLSQNPNSLHLSLGASLFLTTLMSYRFINSGKVMPAGLVAGISLANVLRLSYRIVVPVKEG